ncbi:spectrin beta chain, non-erythrocytic 5 [Conger conger]|uniref:spectrin beta chain, non-erythrocytic 5 n=1 Tax=Conger conger TaxID=82655 RepID=UPI002A5AC204|nr:spectrin beta chain, non-erythrocytic 5 [Conger conger]
MADSILRKIQPFTISTKLSAPTGPKFGHFAESLAPSRDLEPSLSEQVSLYLGGAHSPVAAQVSRLERQRVEAEEDHPTGNAACLSTSSRAIRKISISGNAEPPGDGQPENCGAPKSENINNNNNNIPSSPLPRIIGVSCENKPSPHFKVLLRKGGCVVRQGVLEEGSGGTGTRTNPAFQIPVMRALSPNQEPAKREGLPYGHPEAPPTNDCSFTQRNALFDRELLQAEQWMKVKQQELRDTQRRPLQDGLSHSLQRDLRDFENTLIQLNQMGEQLLCRPNPAADQVRKQLGQLRDQWQALKQAAAGQSKVAGGARNMQEFNRKVDRLEAWIKEKQEEEECLAKLQGENIDRMQLTRRILDLKQDEQLYRSLHEEINHLALKLEKQGKTEGKNISARRKHINKMWQKVQALLKDYHETLQLALEVSSFYQQADNIITAISNKRKSVSVRSEREGSGDREIRDIGSQVMMLEVTVSQLSKLHPALAERVFQKQGEVKEGWTLLQKAVRNEKSALPPTSPDFSRRDEDPLTPCKEQQCSMGAETQRMMGKDIKEEQNRLKGHVSVGNAGRNRKSTGTQEEELLSQSHAPSGTGSSIVRADDITGRPRSGRDRKQTSQSKPGTLPGQAQPRPQMHTQLQKFTVSADKTLSWLKDNVAMATQTCCPATRDGFEAARRRQAALEQEIQSNAARIELVKKEGRGLVRAGHPGSRKIGQFLEQLEALWEELKRRHRRNLHLLQEAERLSIEQAVRVLLQLDSLERGLQTVEAALGGRRGAGDPQNVTAAEQQSSELEREVSARGLQLRSLRQDVERLRRHLQTPQLPLRLEQVEERFRRVQSALTQQSSELRDTRMLTEFLERVELEESQAQQGRCYGDLPQSLHSDAGCRVSVLGLQGHRAGEPLLEGMGDPVEELREAVEMLNDTVRERGRSLCQEQDLQELLSRHSSLTARIAQRLSRAAQLGEDVQGAESDMAVRCEPERSGLEALQEQQEEQETELAGLEREAEEVTALAAQLEEQCPERVQDLAPALRTTLQASAQLRRRCAENRARLRKFTQLRCFFRKYLAMISWTEDTRDRIFSESAVHDGTGSERPEASEMDEKIEQKFRDFDDLAVAGQSLMDAGHHLTELIQERMEELRSMLGWILVRWRSQKHQKKNGRKGKAEPKGDNIYSEATVSPAQQSELQGLAGAPANQPAASPGCHDKLLQTEGGYEVMSSMGLWGGASDTPSPQAPPLVLTQETSPPALGGAVNLILSFSTPGDPQGYTPAGWAETEPVHRPVESHSSACKDFWRRCQGLLGNTLGSLKQKRKIFRQSMDEVQSMSLLSVHMGGGPNAELGRGPAEGGPATTTGPEFQSMEGTLERKHRLQPGGKKAPCRAWSSSHAVLHRHTLCFYQDRKHTLRSSEPGLPLSLLGAECSPAPEYTKRSNCFSLRLRDGSEFLLSASSRFLMRKWLLKIQANSGLSESDPSRRISEPGSQDNLPITQSHTGTARDKEIIVLTRAGTQNAPQHHGILEDLSPRSSSDAGHSDSYSSLRRAVKQRLSQRPRFGDPSPSDSLGRPSSKRRSQSFTSATYQKISPVRPNPAARGGGSSYSVTLVIGDEATPTIAEKPQLIGWRQEAFQDSPGGRGYTSLPRPRNRSVFQRFFGKKEWTHDL